jgi:MraZ protein
MGAQFVFTGRFQHTIDSKGRISIPAKFREALQSGNGEGEKLIVSTDPTDFCLVGYTVEEWHEMGEKIKKFPSLDQNVKNYLRHVFSLAEECALDRQGRILIPPRLRNHANLCRDTILVGMMNKIEIWDLSRWKENEAQFSARANSVSEGMANLGL